jgi:acetyltransferase-like isoleucine patch superfamily enzyme
MQGRNKEGLYLLVSILGQAVIALLVGIAAAPSLLLLRWLWFAVEPPQGELGWAVVFGLTLGGAYLAFGNTLLLLIVLVRNLFGLRNSEKRDRIVSLTTVKSALYNLMLHTANRFFLSLLTGSYISLLFYRGMGAKIGRGAFINTNRIWDCDLIEIGDNCVIGGNASIAAHVVQGDKGHLRKVRIGNNVTIGANTTVMAGAIIEDNVIVGPSSLVPVGARLLAGKTYIGVPVKPVV